MLGRLCAPHAAQLGVVPSVPNGGAICNAADGFSLPPRRPRRLWRAANAQTRLPHRYRAIGRVGALAMAAHWGTRSGGVPYREGALHEGQSGWVGPSHYRVHICAHPALFCTPPCWATPAGPQRLLSVCCRGLLGAPRASAAPARCGAASGCYARTNPEPCAAPARLHSARAIVAAAHAVPPAGPPRRCHGERAGRKQQQPGQ